MFDVQHGYISQLRRYGREGQPSYRTRQGLDRRAQNNGSIRQGDPARSQPVSSEILLSVSIPIFVAITVVNVAVIRIILGKRSLRTIRNMPLVSLALADLIIGLVVGPLSVTAQLSCLAGEVCTTYLIVETFCYVASLMNMFVVAIERSIAIFKPLKHSRYVTPLKIWGMISFAWIFSFFLAVSRPRLRPKAKRRFCAPPLRRTRVYSAFFAAFYIVLSSIMIAMQIKMYLVVKSHRRRIAPKNMGQYSDENGATVGNSAAPEITTNYNNSTEDRQNRRERNDNIDGKIERVAVTLVQVDKETQKRSIITRFFVTDGLGQGDSASNESLSRSESTVQNTDGSGFSLEVITAPARRLRISNNWGGERSPRPSIATIYRTDDTVVGLSLPNSAREPRSSKSLRTMYRPTQFASLLYLAFIFTWTPYIVISLLVHFWQSNRSYEVATISTKILLITNSLLNPLVHTIRMKEVRRHLNQLFLRKNSST